MRQPSSVRHFLDDIDAVPPGATLRFIIQAALQQLMDEQAGLCPQQLTAQLTCIWPRSGAGIFKAEIQLHRPGRLARCKFPTARACGPD